MALSIVCTGMTAQAKEIITSENCDDLSIESCASNIKNIYKQRYPGAEDIIDEVVEDLCVDEQFIDIFNTTGACAFQIVEDSLNDIFIPRVSTCMQTDDLYISCYTFPDIQQNETWSCGVACSLMALIGGGCSEYYYTNNTTITDQWQDDLISELNATSDGTHIQDVTSVLSSKISRENGWRYKYKAFTKNTYNLALDFVCDSLVYDAVPVIQVSDTKLLPYYNGYSTGSPHYIVVEQVDFNAETVQIVDPHYSNRYFGSHTLTFDEFNYVAQNSRDLWMCVLTNTENGAYIY